MQLYITSCNGKVRIFSYVASIAAWFTKTQLYVHIAVLCVIIANIHEDYEIFYRQTFTQAILLLMVISLVAGNSWHVRPDQHTGNFTCPTPNTFCYTLSQVLQQYKEAHSSITALYFQPGVYYLYDDVRFTSLQKLVLQGQGSMPIIRCLNTRHSFTFQHITSTIISNIKFEGCGSVSGSTLVYSRYQSATLHFTHCNDTSVNNITITLSVLV